MMRAALYFLAFVNLVVLVYFVVLNAVYFATSFVAWRALVRYARQLKTFDADDMVRGDAAPPVSLLATAFNEEATCVQSTRSLLTLIYPRYEILIINDGSTDATLAKLTAAFDLVPTFRAPTSTVPHQRVRGVWRSRIHTNLWVIDKENGGGKADALNAGLAYSQAPFFCALDADSLLERDALGRVVRPFLEDVKTIAVGGIIRIANGCTVRDGTVTNVRLPGNLLARFQVLEYLRAFLAGRVGWSSINATLIISGAFGLFRRQIVVDVGGFATDTVGEDMELVVRLHRHCRERGIPYAIRFVPDPVAWTECPESVRVLGRQRDRWQRGLTETLVRHRVMLFNPRYGIIGMVVYPFFFFLEMLGPLIEAAGYVAFAIVVALGTVNATFVLAFFLVAFVLGAVLSVAAVALEELTFRRYPRLGDLVRLMSLSLLEPFGYRQLNTWWRFVGLIRAFRGAKGWGEMPRRGFTEETPS